MALTMSYHNRSTCCACQSNQGLETLSLWSNVMCPMLIRKYSLMKPELSACVCVYIYTHTHTYIYIYIFTYIYAFFVLILCSNHLQANWLLVKLCLYLFNSISYHLPCNSIMLTTLEETKFRSYYCLPIQQPTHSRLFLCVSTASG